MYTFQLPEPVDSYTHGLVYDEHVRADRIRIDYTYGTMHAGEFVANSIGAHTHMVLSGEDMEDFIEQTPGYTPVNADLQAYLDSPKAEKEARKQAKRDAREAARIAALPEPGGETE